MYLQPAPILVAPFHWALFQDTWLSSILLLLLPAASERKSHSLPFRITLYYKSISLRATYVIGSTQLLTIPRSTRAALALSNSGYSFSWMETKGMRYTMRSLSFTLPLPLPLPLPLFLYFFPLKTTRLRTMNFNRDAIKHFAGFHLYLQERKRKKGQNQRKDFDIKCINAQRQIARSEIITALIDPRGSQRSRYMTGSQNNMPLRFFCLRTEEWYGSDWWCTLGIREIRL